MGLLFVIKEHCLSQVPQSVQVSAICFSFWVGFRVPFIKALYISILPCGQYDTNPFFLPDGHNPVLR